jgi:gentisate 1,2-dioxygenase
MSENLGTLEELPLDYRKDLKAAGVSPLWPAMRNVLPYARPEARSKSHVWSYSEVKPLLLQAGDLTPVEKAERRVLVLSDPGRGEQSMQATASLYGGFQLLLPGETAPSHKHTPSAARVVVEGDGAYTVVEGERLPMEEGDVILAPGGSWHEHCHAGNNPVVWLDVLDLPVLYYLEGSYAIEGKSQAQRNRPDASQVEYAASGLVPSRRSRHGVGSYPLQRFPWKRTEEALRKLAAYGGEGAVEVDYINPETGASVMPVMGFTAMMLRPGEKISPPLRSSSALFHVISGSGQVSINGHNTEWMRKDTFSAAVFDALDISAREEEAFLLCVHDTPLQETLGYYEERAR